MKVAPLAISLVAQLLALAAVIGEESSVYVSEKISSMYAAGNTDVRAAKISLDGNYVVYVQSQSDLPDSGGTLFSVPVEGGEPVTLLEGVVDDSAGSGFHVTPDGQSVVALKMVGSSESQVFSVPIAGGVPKFLGNADLPVRRTTLGSGRIFAEYFFLTKDGSRALFNNGIEGLVSSPVSGDPSARVAPGFRVDSCFDDSPDSQTLYFIGGTFSANHMFSVPGDGSAVPKSLAIHSNGISLLPAGSNLHLLPDGSGIIYTIEEGNDLISVEKIVLGSTAPQSIADFSEDQTSTSYDIIYSESGESLFVVQKPPKYAGFPPPAATLHFIDLLTEERITMNSLPSLHSPMLSPGGSHIIYAGDAGIWSQPIDGSPATNLSLGGITGISPIGFSPDAQRVVFIGRNSGSGNRIFSNKLDGSDVVMLSHPINRPRSLGEVSEISHDGQHLFFTADIGGAEGDDYLYRVPLEGGDKVLMNMPGPVGGDVDRLIQNPDGTGFAFIADITDNAIDELFYRAYDQPEETVLSVRGSGDGRLSEFSLTSDSRFAVYRAQQFDPGVDELVAVSTSGGTVRRLNRSPVAKGDVRPGFQISPDGKYAVFLGDLDTNTVTELYSARIEAGGEVKLHRNLSEASESEVYQFWISPDSQYVAFRANIDSRSKRDFYVSAIDGSSIRNISKGLFDQVVRDFTFSPDGKLAVFSGGFSRSGVYVHDIAAGTTTKHPTLRAPDQIKFSADGEMLAFISGFPQERLEFTTLAGDLVANLGRATPNMIFTDDGSRLLFWNPTVRSLFAYKTATGETETLFTSETGINSFVLSSATNHAIVVGGFRDNWEITGVPIRDGAPYSIHVSGAATSVSGTSPYGPIRADPLSETVLYSVNELLFLHRVADVGVSRRVNSGYELAGDYLLIPGSTSGFFVGRPLGNASSPGVFFFQLNSESVDISAVRPHPEHGSGSQGELLLTQDRRQIVYQSDSDAPDIQELFAAAPAMRMVRTTSGNNDAIESAGATDAEASEAFVAAPYWSGLRFEQLPVDQSSEVYSAHVSFTSSTELTGVRRAMVIGVEDAIAPLPFSTIDAPNISNRVLAPGVSASFPLNDWEEGRGYDTPDLANLFEHLFNNPGWARSGAAVLTLSTPTVPDPIPPHRFWLAEGAPGMAPKLELILRPEVAINGGAARLSLGEWTAQHGLGITDLGADPDEDNLTIATEYAFRLDPNLPDPTPYPEFDIIQVDGEPVVRVRYVRDPRRTSASLALVASPDLRNWRQVSVSSQGAPATSGRETELADGNVEVEVILPQPVSEAIYLRFEIRVP